jgi:hypothetical protein
MCDVDEGDDNIVRAVVDEDLPTFIPWFNFEHGPTHLTLPVEATAVASKERFRGGPEPRR